jgi:hypothetical protein
MTEDNTTKVMRTLNESAALSKKFDELFKPLPAFAPSPIDTLFAHQREADRRNRTLVESLRWACEDKERRHAEMVADALARKLKPEADPPEPPPKPKTSREHELHAVIRRVYGALRLPAADLWKALKDPEQRKRFDPDGVIKSMDRNKICWTSWREERKRLMTRKRFEDVVSELNTGRR